MPQEPTAPAVAEVKPSPAAFVVDTPMPESMKGETFSDAEFGIDENFTQRQNLNEDGAKNSAELEEKARVKEAKQKEAAGIKEQEKEVEGKVDDKAKVEAKPEVKGLNIPKDKTKEEPKVEAKPATDGKPVAEDKRGLVNYPETIRESLKKMSTEAFEVFKQTWKEKEEAHKKVESLKLVEQRQAELEKNGYPSDWVNHPEAYTLHPAYKEAARTLSLAAAEERFYGEQLIKIKAGENFQVVTGYNKNGEMQLSEEYKPSPQAELEVGKLFQSAGGIINQSQQRVQAIQQTFGQRYTAAKQSVDKIIDEQWPWYAKEGAEKHPSFPHAAALYNATPPEFRNHPSTVVAGLLYASLQQSLERERDLNSQLEKKATLQEEKVKIEENISSPAKTEQKKNFLRKLTGNRNGPVYTPPETFDMEGLD